MKERTAKSYHESSTCSFPIAISVALAEFLDVLQSVVSLPLVTAFEALELSMLRVDCSTTTRISGAELTSKVMASDDAELAFSAIGIESRNFEIKGNDRGGFETAPDDDELELSEDWDDRFPFARLFGVSHVYHSTM